MNTLRPLSRRLLVTGGAGFIGSAVVRYLIQHTPHTVINLDEFTYAGNLESLQLVTDSPRYHFEQADICDGATLSRIVAELRGCISIRLAVDMY